MIDWTSKWEMFFKNWTCFRCPSLGKPNRRAVIAPIEPSPDPPEPIRPAVRVRNKSDLSRWTCPVMKQLMYCSLRIALAAVVIIQSWFRRRQAILEIRRKAAWTIYQNIEYAGEQDQLKVSKITLVIQAENVYLITVAQLLLATHASCRHGSTWHSSGDQSSTSELVYLQFGYCHHSKEEELTLFLEEEMDLEHVTAPKSIPIESSYHGPHIHTPIHKGHFEALILAFQRGEVWSKLATRLAFLKLN